MTIVIGIKCRDGIVIACDSQVGFSRGVDVKRLNANKIHNWDDRFAIAGSGLLAQIQTTVESIKAAIRGAEQQRRTELDKDECEDVVERVLWALHNRYNVLRSNEIGLTERDFFDPLSVFANKITGESEFCLYILHVPGLVEPVENYGTIGSGAAYAELLLKNLYTTGIGTSDAVKIAAYVINEVKEIDPNCGGPTKIGVLSQTGFSELSEIDILASLQAVKSALNLVRTDLVRGILIGEVDESRIRQITRQREEA